jgi:hypothetical protein
MYGNSYVNICTGVESVMAALLTLAELHIYFTIIDFVSKAES